MGKLVWRITLLVRSCVFCSQAMGASLSKSLSGNSKAQQACNRLRVLVKNAWWLGGNIVWVAATSAIVLAMPVIFNYEKECQLFEQHAMFMQAQQAAAAQQLPMN
eukprot:GHVT01001107.1.p1 GENE.GHVT01001107.1~~GHVT01001107.1.p1  ORF type:complete len:105 (-),score=12.68 GHVT01001107.1:499-813(-)